MGQPMVAGTVNHGRDKGDPPAKYVKTAKTGSRLRNPVADEPRATDGSLVCHLAELAIVRKVVSPSRAMFAGAALLKLLNLLKLPIALARLSL